MTDKEMEIASSTQTAARQREVQLLINIAEPDPSYQPVMVSDEASLLDAVITPPEVIARRLTAYFGVDLRLELALPIWRLVDEIRRLTPGWPEDFDPN
jgi:hypothetical protein